MNREELKRLEDDLWRSADTLRANSDLNSNEYSTPVLGLIFLKFADNKYRQHEAAILAEYEQLKGTRREKEIANIALERCGFYLPAHARYDYLLQLPAEQDLARAVKDAMRAVEEYKPELRGVLPQDEYFRLTRTDRTIPKQLLKNFSNIPVTASGDVFGQIYEYFLGNFARAEGQGGGEFFTPRSVVKLMVEIIEPHRGTVFDPACGSGGMFVQSANFIEQHRSEFANADKNDLFVFGQEKKGETVKLAKMNLAVNGLRGDIKQAISYYENPFDSFGKFDYVLANPPFNVDDVSLSAIEKDERFNRFGVPRNKSKVKKADEGKETVPNANYLWISLFATSLKPAGRAALVMANSASDARHSEADIRQKLIENNLIYAMLALPSNMFYTVTLPATVWFFDRAKPDDKILFLDARNVFTQIDRVHREFSDEQVQNLAVIADLQRGRRGRFVDLIDGYFQQGEIKLRENRERVEPVSESVLIVLDTPESRQAIENFCGQWARFDDLPSAANRMADDFDAGDDAENDRDAQIDRRNRMQRDKREQFEPFFDGLHRALKQLDQVVRQHEKQLAEAAKAEGKRAAVDRNLKNLKTALEELHAEARDAESFYKHIAWLHERFPRARYEDVTGLCKLATPAEIREQDYSLNPGRYVGVVIEEDGKTEEEFIGEILSLNDELETLNAEASGLEKIIGGNVKAITGYL